MNDIEEDTLVPKEMPIPGTHKDVVVYPTYGAIGVYYDSEKEDTIEGSGLIFNDFEDTKARVQRGLQNAVDEELIVMKYKDKETERMVESKYSDITHIPFDMIYESDLVIKVYSAWLETITTCPRGYVHSKPRAKIIDEYGYSFLRDQKIQEPATAGMPYDILEFVRAVSNNFYTGHIATTESRNEEISAMSPLFHFPPVGKGSHTRILDRTLFFNKQQPVASLMTLLNNYGDAAGKAIFSACSKLNRNIYVGELIKATGRFGYNISTNWSLLGFPNMDLELPFEDYILTRADLVRKMMSVNEKYWNLGVFTESGKRVKKCAIFDNDVVMSNPFHFMSEVWGGRDKLIMYFMQGGPIPAVNPSGVWQNIPGFNPMWKFSRFAMVNPKLGYDPPGLWDLYPVYWDYSPGSGGSILGFIFKMLATLVVMVVGVLTGTTGALGAVAGLFTQLIQMAADYVMKKIVATVGEEYAALGMALSGVLSGVMNKYIDIPNLDNNQQPSPASMKYDKAYRFFLNSGLDEFKDIVATPEKKSLFTTSLYNFDTGLSDRQKVTMEMMLRHIDARYGHFLDKTDPGTPNGILLQRDQIAKSKAKVLDASAALREMQTKYIEKKVNDKSTREALTTMALAGLGGFALWQILKKK
jgi:hypothetical protein